MMPPLAVPPPVISVSSPDENCDEDMRSWLFGESPRREFTTPSKAPAAPLADTPAKARIPDADIDAILHGGGCAGPTT